MRDICGLYTREAGCVLLPLPGTGAPPAVDEQRPLAVLLDDPCRAAGRRALAPAARSPAGAGLPAARMCFCAMAVLRSACGIQRGARPHLPH